MTLNNSCHKHAYNLLICHDYEGVMLVLCTPLQVKCYPIRFHLLPLVNQHELTMINTYFTVFNNLC